SEAFWKIVEYNGYDRPHSVVRLSVHRPDQQQIIFEEGHEYENCESRKERMLTAWYKLQRIKKLLHNLYYQVPESYAIDNQERKVKKRKRQQWHIIGRMHTVSPRDGERFYLRNMLQKNTKCQMISRPLNCA